jgi:cytochrome c-type protein NapC
MDFTRQSVRAAEAHSTYLANGEKTCIDCHKGIAHQLPDMKGVPGWDVTYASPVHLLLGEVEASAAAGE